MNHKIVYGFILITLSFLTGCGNSKKLSMTNPLLEPYKTPYGIPPFHEIKNADFKPAILEAIQKHQKEIDHITSNPQPATFQNTIEALEYSGRLLQSVTSVFFNFLSANTSDELQNIAKEISPSLTKHSDNINLNPKLFNRVRAVYQQKSSLGLSQEQKMLLEKTYKNFVRGGAGLNNLDQKSLREINEKLSVLSLKFGDHVLADINKFALVIDQESDLSGLPETVVAAAADEAKNRGLENKWVFTLHVPSYEAFMRYADNRALREVMYKAYTEKANHDDEHDNKQILAEIAELRAERAQLLGYPNHAAYILEEAMAKNPENVNKRLQELWNATLPVEAKEEKALNQLAKEEGDSITIQGWDWRYYAEKLRKKAYNFDEETFRPYLSLDNVRKGLFLACKRLYGIEFTEHNDLPSYHKEAIPYEVKDKDGSFLGIIYADFFPRASKRGGAWMTEYREQYIQPDGQFITPVISVVFNFSRPAQDSVALLNFDEASTLFHEFGHAMHGLLSKVTYPSLSGTNVPRDFVEFPSQFFENWVTDASFMKEFAKHYTTHEAIPDSLIEKYQRASKFNQGFATTEYLAASILDMSYHTISAETKIGDVNQFERNVLDKIHLSSAIPPRYRSTYFNHIFNGGYSAGYYSYIWSEMLDADAFAYFKQKGIFDSQTALSYRKNILEKGNTEEPMKLYIQFRGQEPGIDALLERRGLK